MRYVLTEQNELQFIDISLDIMGYSGTYYLYFYPKRSLYKYRSDTIFYDVYVSFRPDQLCQKTGQFRYYRFIFKDKARTKEEWTELDNPKLHSLMKSIIQQLEATMKKNINGIPKWFKKIDNNSTRCPHCKKYIKSK